MKIRSLQSNSVLRPLAMSLVCVMLITTMGCSISPKPRNHWWQFWRTQHTPDSVRIYQPDDVVLPPTPDVLGPDGSGVSEGLPVETLPPPPVAGDMAEPEAVRTPATNVVSELKTVYFGFDSSQLDGGAIAALDNNAAWLMQHPGYEIQLQGHCDERGTTEYNLNLGDLRAKAVKAYLAGKGVSPDSMHTISYGEERPIDPGHGEASWSLNRRVEFLVY